MQNIIEEVVNKRFPFIVGLRCFCSSSHNIEVENGTLEDVFNLSMSHFPLPWLLEKE